MTILLTGANGFIGKRLCSLASSSSLPLRKVVRSPDGTSNSVKGSLDPSFDWSEVLAGIDTVVHLAAKVHVLDNKSRDSLAQIQKVNIEGSLNLGGQAARAGVKRFIFISSIGVYGNQCSGPITVHDPPAPVEPYAVSKLEAEMGLRKISAETGLEMVIIRPPLVYGPGAPGNFARLLHLVQKGLPLPLGLVQNKRSLVAVDNLVDLILTCVEHPAAAGQTFLVSDGEDLSTPELIRKLAWSMGKRPRLLPVPPGLLRLGGTMLGKRQEVEKLTSSLQVDIGHTCETLGWRPPVSVDAGLAEVGRNWTANCANLRE